MARSGVANSSLPDGASFERVAHFRQFRLPGGEAAIKQPHRSALGLLHAMMGDSVFQQQAIPAVRDLSAKESALIRRMLATGAHSPLASSVGRLFDAVASLLDLRKKISFEGQAAMALEFAVVECIADGYPFELRGGAPLIVDWQPMIESILGEIEEGLPAGIIAAKFHNTLAEITVAVAKRDRRSEPKVVLSGGCFQNRYLTGQCIQRLHRAGCQPYCHQRVPTNDGGIALGQVMAVRGARCKADIPSTHGGRRMC